MLIIYKHNNKASVQFIKDVLNKQEISNQVICTAKY